MSASASSIAAEGRGRWWLSRTTTLLATPLLHVTERIQANRILIPIFNYKCYQSLLLISMFSNNNLKLKMKAIYFAHPFTFRTGIPYPIKGRIAVIGRRPKIFLYLEAKKTGQNLGALVEKEGLSLTLFVVLGLIYWQRYHYYAM